MSCHPIRWIQYLLKRYGSIGGHEAWLRFARTARCPCDSAGITPLRDVSGFHAKQLIDPAYATVGTVGSDWNTNCSPNSSTYKARPTRMPFGIPPIRRSIPSEICLPRILSGCVEVKKTARFAKRSVPSEVGGDGARRDACTGKVCRPNQCLWRELWVSANLGFYVLALLRPGAGRRTMYFPHHFAGGYGGYGEWGDAADSAVYD